MGFASVPDMQDRPFGTPPELRTAVTPMPMSEDSVQRAVVQHLRTRGAPGLVFFHVPNGGRRGKIEGARFKALGVLAGVADLILLHRGEAFALELKAAKGRASPAQDQFLAQFRQAGGYAFTAEGLDNALIILKHWGLLE